MTNVYILSVNTNGFSVYIYTGTTSSTSRALHSAVGGEDLSSGEHKERHLDDSCGKVWPWICFV